MEANQLVKEIDNIIKNDYQFENEEFENCIFKKLKDNNEETNRKGFMIFAERVDNFEMDADYPYKRRYYYVEKLNDNENNENKKNKKNKKIIFVLFNCSTSNPEKLDDTVRNCKSLAQKNKYSQIEVLNLFSIRNPKVKNIDDNDISHDNEYEKLNFKFITELLKSRKICDVVLAWGHGKKNPSYNQNKNDIIKARIGDMEKFCNEFSSKNIKFKKLSVNISNKKIIEYIKQKDRHPSNQAWSEFGKFLDVAELTEYDFKNNQ